MVTSLSPVRRGIMPASSPILSEQGLAASVSSGSGYHSPRAWEGGPPECLLEWMAEAGSARLGATRFVGIQWDYVLTCSALVQGLFTVDRGGKPLNSALPACKFDVRDVGPLSFGSSRPVLRCLNILLDLGAQRSVTETG
jgi:hypothetical protein